MRHCCTTCKIIANMAYSEYRLLHRVQHICQFGGHSTYIVADRARSLPNCLLTAHIVAYRAKLSPTCTNSQQKETPSPVTVVWISLFRILFSLSSNVLQAGINLYMAQAVCREGFRLIPCSLACFCTGGFREAARMHARMHRRPMTVKVGLNPPRNAATNEPDNAPIPKPW
ncbi:hypothetical protein D3C73_801460 [compost metagenome]